MNSFLDPVPILNLGFAYSGHLKTKICELGFNIFVNFLSANIFVNRRVESNQDLDGRVSISFYYVQESEV